MWQWWNYLCGQIPVGKVALRMSMDETSVCLFQGVGKGVCRLCRQKSRATKAFSFRSACYRLWTLSTQRMLQSQRHVRSEELRAPLHVIPAPPGMRVPPEAPILRPQSRLIVAVISAWCYGCASFGVEVESSLCTRYLVELLKDNG